MSSGLSRAVVQYPSKVKFFKKDNCKYQVQLIEDAKRIAESYEVEVNAFSFQNISSSIKPLGILRDWFLIGQ